MFLPKVEFKISTVVSVFQPSIDLSCNKTIGTHIHVYSIRGAGSGGGQT